MKSRKTMKHQQLIAETVDQLKARFQPRVPDVKKGIDAMLDREYIEREEGSRDTYRCVASGREISPLFPSLACLILADQNSFTSWHSLSGTSPKLATPLSSGPTVRDCAIPRRTRSHCFCPISSRLVLVFQPQNYTPPPSAFADDSSVHVPRLLVSSPRRSHHRRSPHSGRERRVPFHPSSLPLSLPCMKCPPPLDACFRLFCSLLTSSSLLAPVQAGDVTRTLSFAMT